jgi:hypothetical protein
MVTALTTTSMCPVFDYALPASSSPGWPFYKCLLIFAASYSASSMGSPLPSLRAAVATPFLRAHSSSSAVSGTLPVKNRRHGRYNPLSKMGKNTRGVVYWEMNIHDTSVENEARSRSAVHYPSPQGAL